MTEPNSDNRLPQSSNIRASENIEDKDDEEESLECPETFFLVEFDKLIEQVKNDTGDKCRELSDLDLSNMVCH